MSASDCRCHSAMPAAQRPPDVAGHVLIAFLAIPVGGLLNIVLGGWAWLLPGLVLLVVWGVRTID